MCRYGLVYPGLGWIIWRSEEFLPEDLVFYANYLGNEDVLMCPNIRETFSVENSTETHLILLSLEDHHCIHNIHSAAFDLSSQGHCLQLVYGTAKQCTS